MSLPGLHAELAFIESKNTLNVVAMSTLLMPASGILVILGTAGGADDSPEAFSADRGELGLRVGPDELVS